MSKLVKAVIRHMLRVNESRKMGKAKYPCLDGINRDKQIDDYLKIEKDIVILERTIRAAQSKRATLLEKLYELDVNYIGTLGALALEKERRRREVNRMKSAR